MRVIVIGGGILGAAIAHALRGADVTVLSDGRGATGASFGWIGASFALDAAHHRLRAEGLAAWSRLMAQLDVPVVRCGTLSWEGMDADALRGWGYDVEDVDAARFTRLEPQIAAPPDHALRFRAELAADPGAAAARMSGRARVISGACAEGIAHRAGRVTGVRTPFGTLPADRVVVAAGAGSEALLRRVDVPLPLVPRPGLMVRTAPMTARLSHICVAPEQEFRQHPDGTLSAPTVAAHQGDNSAEITERPDHLADQTCARLSRLLDVPVTWQQVQRANRPMPADARPVIGRAGPEGLHVAVMHSGVTLAAITAEVTAAQVQERPLSNLHSDLIAPYRPDRFQSAIS